LLFGGFPVVVDGAFKRQSEREPVIEAARKDRRAARLSPDHLRHRRAARRRLEGRQQHDTRSDGRVELMEHQRADFEPPNPEAECFFHTVDTSGPKTETQAKVDAPLTTAETCPSSGDSPR
jgi:predicted kinase